MAFVQRLRRVAGALAVLGAALLAARIPADLKAAAVPRAVYISAVNPTGEFVTDLTPADIVVKKNGQLCEVIGLDPATDPFHAAIVVDDGGNGHMQLPVAELLNAGAGHGLFSINMLNPQSIRLNDFSTSADVLQRSVARLIERGRVPRDLDVLADAVSAAARDLEKRKLARPVIVVLTNGGEAADREVARAILDELRTSGAALHLVHVVAAELGMVLVEGPPQSGGSSTPATSTRGFADATAAIARTLAHQYKLTWSEPAGAGSGDRLQVTATRPGVKVIAPTRVPSR